MKACVYTMKSSRPECRVGFHTTSDRQRLREVNKGQNITWQIHGESMPFSSQWVARAVEALAHARLEPYANKYPTGASSKAGVPIKAWGFTCKPAVAQAAIRWAADKVLASLEDQGEVG